ncbi:MAG: hypothetical protein AAB229_07195 [Candidatus Hydrogenedentota bacterium]
MKKYFGHTISGALCILTAGTFIAAWAAGEVSIPLDEWNTLQKEVETLRTDAKKKAPDLPPDAAISSASYSARPVRGGLKITAKLFVIALGNGKTMLPLFGGTAAVTSSVLPTGCALSAGTGGTALMVQAPGRYAIDLELVAAGEGTSVEFGLPRAGANLFRIALPGATATAKIEPSVGITRTSTGGVTTLETVLPPTDRLKVEWSSVGGAIQQEQGEGRIYLTTHIATMIEQETIRGRTRLDYEVKGGVAFEFALRIPRDLAVADVTGDGISHWKVETGEEESLLVIHPQSPLAGAARFTISWDAPLSSSSQIAEIPRFRGVKVAREAGMIGVAAGEATEIGSAEAGGVVSLDPRTAPKALTEMIDRPLTYAGRFSSESWSVNVAVRRLEAVDVVAARIEEAMGASVLLPSGRIVHRYVALVRNSTVDFLDLRLPPGSRIWGAAVGAKIVRAIRGQEPDQYRLPLARAQSAEAGGTVFGVEIVYSVDRDANFAGGQMEIQPPIVSLDAGRQAWALHVPPDYSVAGTWGSGDWEAADPTEWSVVADSLRNAGHDAPASSLGFPTEALDGPVRMFTLSSNDANIDPRSVSLFFLTNKFNVMLEVLVLLAGLLGMYVPLRHLAFPRRLRICVVAIAGAAIFLELVFGGMLVRLLQGCGGGLLLAIAWHLMKREELAVLKTAKPEQMTGDSA